MTIFETRNGQLWIGTHGGGAYVLDPVTGLVRQLPDALPRRRWGPSAPPVSPRSPRIRNGNFWIGTDGGGLDLARG